LASSFNQTRKPSCGLQETAPVQSQWRAIQGRWPVRESGSRLANVLAHRIERMVEADDEPDPHVHNGAQGAQIVALRHELSAQPIQRYIFGQFGHCVASADNMAGIALPGRIGLAILASDQ